MFGLTSVSNFSHAATDGVIPNQVFAPAEQYEIISPQLGTIHFNQPSVFNGYLIFSGDGVHEVWDISNPYSPSYLTTMTSPDEPLGNPDPNGGKREAESHQVTYGRDGAGNYCLATISGTGIDIWDVTTTTSPTFKGKVVLPGIVYGDVAGAIWGVCWQGKYLYCGATNQGVYVIDMSDPANPNHVATMSVSQLGGVWAGPVFALGDLLVVTTPKSHSGIATVDISNPTSPVLLDTFVPSSGKKSYIGGFYGTDAHLIRPYRTYDVTTDPRNITAINTNIQHDSEYVSFSDNYLYLGGTRGGTQGIYKYDITNPASPVLAGRIEGRNNKWDDQFSCPIGNIVAIADDQKVNGKYVGGIIAVHETGKDLTGISVKHAYPDDGATNQSLSGQIAISFSEWPEFKSVDPSTFILRPVGGAAISGQWGCTYTTLSFSSDAPLSPGTTYEIVLPAGGVTDLVGNGIAATFISTFTTGTGLVGFPGDDSINAVPPVALSNGSSFSVKIPDASRVYTWDFGDGNSDTGSAVTHSYTAPGRYAVVFQASNVSGDITLEAEDANSAGGVSVATNNTGYTGSGFADYPGSQGAGVKLTWTVNASTAVTRDLHIRYALGNATARPLNLYINGGSATLLNFTDTGAWTTWVDLTVSNVSLAAGVNTIELVADAGSAGANIDHLRLLHPDAGGSPTVTAFTHIVYNAPTALSPTSSQAMLLDGAKVWAVNPDADSVTAINAQTLAKEVEIAVGDHPKVIARAPDGSLWVVCQDSWEIKVINPATGTVTGTIALPYASQPVGLAFAPDGSAAYVTLQALGRLIKLDPSSHAILGSLDFGSNELAARVRGITIDSTSSRVFVTRFISLDTSGEIFEVDASTMTLTRTITLAKATGTDTALFARGVPNYLASIALSPDGTRAWVPSKKDNIDRGVTRDGLELDHDVTVRAIASAINPSTGLEDPALRVDIDDSDRCHSCSFSPVGDLVFITLPGNNEVAVRNAYNSGAVATITTQKTPNATVIDAATGRLYVHNFMSRSVSAYDVNDLLNGGNSYTLLGHTPVVTTEALSVEVLIGKQHFYDATSAQINLAGYMSCASCHLDGSNDGRTYDFTAPMGEGFRNTIDLRGHAGNKHGRLHWTANFDEIHDFEGQLRLLGKGSGLMAESDFNSGTRSQSLGDPKNGYSADLDALAAYVTSLDTFAPSPFRQSNGTLTTDGAAGKILFNNLNCFSCHGGEDFTDSALGSLHDVGTIKLTSGQRMGGSLTGLDTPTLRGIWETAPYLHDGSAATLLDVISAANLTDEHGVTSGLSSTEKNQLVSYLLQIDGIEPGATPATGVDSPTFTTYISGYPLAGADATPGADPDGDGFSNHDEWMMGESSPTDASKRPLTLADMVDDNGESFLEISWLHRTGGVWKGKDYILGGSAYQPQASHDLVSWNGSIQTVSNPAGLPTPPDGFEWATSRFTVPLQNESRWFLRLMFVE